MSLKSLIQSILFVSSKPLSVNALAKHTKSSKDEVAAALTELQTEHQHSGVVILESHGEYQFATNAQNVEEVKNFLNSDLREKLTDATVEVLSIIAYRQPIAKTEIEAIRGVNSQYSIRHLLMRGLIEKVPNPNDARGSLYQVTTEFLQQMGITSIAELPDFETFTNQIKLPETPATKNEDGINDPTLNDATESDTDNNNDSNDNDLTTDGIDNATENETIAQLEEALSISPQLATEDGMVSNSIGEEETEDDPDEINELDLQESANSSDDDDDEELSLNDLQSSDEDDDSDEDDNDNENVEFIPVTTTDEIGNNAEDDEEDEENEEEDTDEAGNGETNKNNEDDDSDNDEEEDDEEDDDDMEVLEDDPDEIITDLDPLIPEPGLPNQPLPA